MSNVSLKATWIFDLDPADARIVMRALGGRLAEPEVSVAKELGDRLTRLRATAAKSLHDSMTKHEENIESEP